MEEIPYQVCKYIISPQENFATSFRSFVRPPCQTAQIFHQQVSPDHLGPGNPVPARNKWLFQYGLLEILYGNGWKWVGLGKHPDLFLVGTGFPELKPSDVTGKTRQLQELLARARGHLHDADSSANRASVNWDLGESKSGIWRTYLPGQCSNL